MTGSLAPRLRAALDRAADDGRTVDLWLRDDDAVEHTAALDRLLATAARFGVPVAIAAVPARVGRSLVDRLRGEPAVTVLTHGLWHRNHAPAGGKPAEFGPDRPLPALEADLSDATRTMDALFGRQATPVLVPPWNRIAPALAARLPALGIRAMSAFGTAVDRRHAGPSPRIDTHLDPVAWHSTRSLAEADAIAAPALRALDAGTAALGILTHHLVFDDALWRWTEEVLAETVRHPAIRLRSVDDLLPAVPADRAPASAGVPLERAA